MLLKLSGAIAGLMQSPPTFSTLFALCAGVEGPCTEEALRSALDRLGRRHPMLVSHAALRDGAAYQTDEPPAPIPLQVIDRAGDEAWKGVAEREVEIPSDHRTGPLARCVWLRGAPRSDLVLLLDHAAADGRAAIYVLRDLLRLLVDPALDLAPLAPPRLADRLPPHAWPHIQRAIDEDAADAATGAPHEAPGFEGAPVRIASFALDEGETGGLIAACRAAGVTVHAALCAACIVPFAEREPAATAWRVETPVDIRGHLTPAIGEVCNVYISTVVNAVAYRAESDPWDIARALGAALRVSLSDPVLLAGPTVLLQVADHLPIHKLMGLDYDLSVSNLGRVEIPTRYGDLRLRAAYAPLFNVGPTTRRFGVVTLAGRLHCAFISRDPHAHAIAGRVRTVLAGMIAAPSSA